MTNKIPAAENQDSSAPGYYHLAIRGSDLTVTDPSGTKVPLMLDDQTMELIGPLLGLHRVPGQHVHHRNALAEDFVREADARDSRHAYLREYFGGHEPKPASRKGRGLDIPDLHPAGESDDGGDSWEDTCYPTCPACQSMRVIDEALR